MSHRQFAAQSADQAQSTAQANALAETVNGYYKAELIRGPARGGRPWKTVEEVELATLGWVHWHNTERLHGYLNDLPPVEFEALHVADSELSTPNPGDPAITDTVPRAADRLTTPRTEPIESQNAMVAPADGPPAPEKRSRPPAPAGAVTIMCGSPGSGINRTARRPRTTAGTSKEPPA